MPLSLLERDKEVVWHPFSPVKGGYPVLPLSHGEGIYLVTEDGKKIIDGISSWWVNILGHSHPEIAAALYEQAKKLPHAIFAGFTHEPAVKLSEEILKEAPHQSKAFFSDNGSTSVEVAIKIAIQYWKNKGKEKRKKIIALEGAYHGDTFGAMAVGERGGFNIAFEPYLFDVEFIPFPDENNFHSTETRLRELVKSGEIAAFIFEPLVQGAAGMRIYSNDHLDQLINIAKKADVLCIADEVFTGFYRTGKMFATDYLKNHPDIVCLSKGLTAGYLPLSITTVSHKVFAEFDNNDREKAFYHGHSFTGNPLGCSVAVKSFEILRREETLKNIQSISSAHKNFISQITDHPRIINIKSLGTILSIEMKTDSPTGYFNKLREKIYRYFIDKGILLRPLGNVLYLVPPYVITEPELNFIYKEIENFLNQKNFF